MRADVEKLLAAKKRLGLLQELFDALDVNKQGVVTVEGFVAQAKSSEQAEELKVDFAAFDQAVGADQADGQLTFRKFVTGTMKTPLGRLQDAQFESAVSGMITDAKAKLGPTPEVS